tara:strand:- start:164 stop:1045 length:882 start_codon:yes stop_codon:yes gene_type:complete
MELYKEKVDQAIVGQFYKIDNIINEDCDLYDQDSGELIFTFKKKIIADETYNIDPKIVKHSQMLSYNRGSAGGVVNSKGIRRGMEGWKKKPECPCDKNGNPLPEGHEKHTSYFRYEDGRISKRARSNSVASQSIGGFDKSPQHPCRLTYWTKNNLEAYESIFPLCKDISEKYFSYCPDKWLGQYEKYQNCPQDYVIPETNFSTLTINCDFRTACHRDKGDCKAGLTAFTVKRLGDYRGGELCFPEYQLGLNIEQGDLLLFNPHTPHSNNPLVGKGRMSFVLYLREKMDRCESI